MMNAFSIVNITPYVRDSLEGKSMLFHSKDVSLLLSLWEQNIIGHSSEREALFCFIDMFERYQGITYSHTGRVDKAWWTLC